MLPVTKYHGCGNDFIILREEDAVGYDLNTLIPAVCDRHTGLGADGLILVRVRPLTMLFITAMDPVLPCVEMASAVLQKILPGRRHHRRKTVRRRDLGGH